jgi:hypothetical protein
MSAEEVARAYSEGRISRRSLVRRLVAGGISFGAAVSYAHLLGQERAQAGFDDEYTGQVIGVQGKLLQQDLDQVVADERVKVRYSVDRRAAIELRLFLSRPGNPYPYSQIGVKDFETRGPVDRRETFVRLNVNPPHGRDALQALSSANLKLETVAHRVAHPHRYPNFGYFEHTRTIS